jgi:hypothetical protein
MWQMSQGSEFAIFYLYGMLANTSEQQLMVLEFHSLFEQIKTKSKTHRKEQ